MLYFTRKQNKLNKYIETQKEKFTQLDLQDVEVREKIKHSKSKNKKLQKQLEKDKEKVCCLHGETHFNNVVYLDSLQLFFTIYKCIHLHKNKGALSRNKRAKLAWHSSIVFILSSGQERNMGTKNTISVAYRKHKGCCFKAQRSRHLSDDWQNSTTTSDCLYIYGLILFLLMFFYYTQNFRWILECI